MTTLLPEGDKVHTKISDAQYVSVPNGMVWKVAIISTGVAEVRTNNGEIVGKFDTDGSNADPKEVTLHSDTRVRATNGAETLITGWEFDYS